MKYNVFEITTSQLCYILLLTFTAFSNASKVVHEFSNEWAVEIQGGDSVADEVAHIHGYVNHGKIMKQESFYLFEHPKLKKRSIEKRLDHHDSLMSHKDVKWVEQQRIKRRVKRDIYKPQETPDDPMWGKMWYLLPNTNPSMFVKEAWEAGFTGKNVSVTILDDGIEHDHPDLQANYDPKASSDINDHDSDPSPRLNPTNENRHGTRCAGEVAAVVNNGICSVGIAYNSKIGGVRMLDGQVTDAVEAASIGFSPQHVDIYSASWGPDDDGRTVDGPARLARLAFVNGVKEGRGGRGSIFVWASGNGGRHNDNCNCDGYTDSIYTLSISSATQEKGKPWYSESCSSTLASTYSSGSQYDKQVITTDLRHSCTSTHTGTSASAPLAAGICALALEANPLLTWRDMQHLVVQTARPDQLEADDWVVNGANRKVSHAFGYGLMDAHAMVMKARNWTLAPSQLRCTKSVVSSAHTPRVFSSNQRMTISVRVVACDDNQSMIDRLEHVQAVLTLKNGRRGDLEIFLTSPQGTRSQLLSNRRQDTSSKGFTEWAFMTTHSWDENPLGNWTLEIHNRNTNPSTGYLSLYNLTMYGTINKDWPIRRSNPPQSHPTKVGKLAPPTAAKSFTPDTDFPIPPDHNCKVPLGQNQGCLVCNQPFSLDVTTKLCVTSCSSGFYQTLERVNEKGEKQKNSAPRGMSSEYHFEVVEEETFEDEERFYKALSCHPCSSHCHSCSGPYPSDCVQCVTGAEHQNNRQGCFLVSSSISKPKSSAVFLLIIALTVVFFTILIFLFRSYIRSRFCCKSSTFTYKSLPDVDDNIEYHDNDGNDDAPSVTVKLNTVENGVYQ